MNLNIFLTLLYILILLFCLIVHFRPRVVCDHVLTTCFLLTGGDSPLRSSLVCNQPSLIFLLVLLLIAFDFFMPTLNQYDDRSNPNPTLSLTHNTALHRAPTTISTLVTLTLTLTLTLFLP